MRTKLTTAVFPGIIGLASAAVLLVGCQASQKTAASADASPQRQAAKVDPPVKMEPRSLVEGGTAYIRIKEFTSAPQKGWTPIGKEARLAYGDPVTLVKKKEKDGPNNIFWLASKEAGVQLWIPAYLLTSSQAEINSLKTKDRIPETMTFFYGGKGSTRVAGKVTLGPFVLETDAAVASNQGSDQAAFKGNGVVFDAIGARAGWTPPFSNGNKNWDISPSLMCYCTSVDESKGGPGCAASSGMVSDCSAPAPTHAKGTFDCIEVAAEPVAAAQQKAP